MFELYLILTTVVLIFELHLILTAVVLIFVLYLILTSVDTKTEDLESVNQIC